MFIRLLALWRKEALALSRDRFGLATLFVMPAVFILVMSLALKETLRPASTGPQIHFAVVDRDGTQASREATELLASQNFIPDPAPQDEAAARDRVARGKVPFVVVFPQGFETRLGDQVAATGLVTLLLDPTVTALARAGFRQHLQGVLGTLKARNFLRTMDPMFGGAAANALDPQVFQGTVQEEAVRQGAAVQPPSAVQQNVPAWLIFGMFFVVLPMSAQFINERKDGTLQRQRSLGLGHGILLGGRLVPFMVVNLIQAILMLTVGVWLVPRFGGESLALPPALWPALAAATLCVSFGAVSWALLVATLVRTTEQATALGGVGNLLMAALGGIMVPRFVMPSEMQAFARWSPMAWGLDAFHAVMLRGAGWTGMAPFAARLLIFGALALASATLLARRGNP